MSWYKIFIRTNSYNYVSATHLIGKATSNKNDWTGALFTYSQNSKRKITAIVSSRSFIMRWSVAPQYRYKISHDSSFKWDPSSRVAVVSISPFLKRRWSWITEYTRSWITLKTPWTTATENSSFEFFSILATIIRSWVDFPGWKVDKNFIQTTEKAAFL